MMLSIEDSVTGRYDLHYVESAVKLTNQPTCYSLRWMGVSMTSVGHVTLVIPSQWPLVSLLRNNRCARR